LKGGKIVAMLCETGLAERQVERVVAAGLTPQTFTINFPSVDKGGSQG
jgi:hypothetical protein